MQISEIILNTKDKAYNCGIRFVRLGHRDSGLELLAGRDED